MTITAGSTSGTATFSLDPTDDTGGARPVRLEADVGYGVAVLGGRGVLTIQGGVGMASGGTRRLRVAGLLDSGGPAELSLTLEHETAGAGESSLGIALNLRIAW